MSNDRKWNVARVSPITTSGEEAARNCVFFSSSGTKHQTFIFIFIISMLYFVYFILRILTGHALYNIHIEETSSFLQHCCVAKSPSHRGAGGLLGRDSNLGPSLWQAGDAKDQNLALPAAF